MADIDEAAAPAALDDVRSAGAGSGAAEPMFVQVRPPPNHHAQLVWLPIDRRKQDVCTLVQLLLSIMGLRRPWQGPAWRSSCRETASLD